MKMTNNIRFIFLAIISTIIALSSCRKEYYEDGGVHDPNYDGTILQFLKSRPELFDTLVKVLELGEYSTLLNDPNANVTFFAPTSQSISKSIRALNSVLYTRGQDTVLDVRQVSPEVWKKYLSKYIYRDKYLLKDYPQIDTSDMLAYPGQGYISIGGEAMNIGTFYNTNPVATSNIQPNNGVIHVLQYFRHSFGFYSYDFASDAFNMGITY
jgi:uncharacterized surface protein with fasciclin (FAS1) repeats